MRRLQMPALIALLATLLGSQLKGCSDEFQRTYVDHVAIVTSVYCLAPEPLRAQIRALTDATAAPNRIRVECAADAL